MRALITGVSGQDGSYLSELLLSKGYEVYGLVRRLSTPTYPNIKHLKDLKLIEGDMIDPGSLLRAVRLSKPDEVYNLAAQSFVGGSFNYPVSTAQITGLGTLRLLEAVSLVRPSARFYQASSSEMFGNQEGVLDERSPLLPVSPYGSAKVFAHNSAESYRDRLAVSCGILFNHESPRRGEQFVTRKITKAVARIKQKKQKELILGDLKPRRDWGDARDYVKAMYEMLQIRPDTYVICTGLSHSVQDFAEMAFSSQGLEWEKYVKSDPKFLRPTEIYELTGTAAKAYAGFGWKPERSLRETVGDMVEADLE